MKYLLIACLLCLTHIGLAHTKDQSRSEIFRSELRLNDTALNQVVEIDNRYRIIYQRINAEIQFRNSELKEITQSKPYNEDKAKRVLKKIADAQVDLRLNSIRHHLEIEKKLDSYQKMKFNEIFNP